MSEVAKYPKICQQNSIKLGNSCQRDNIGFLSIDQSKMSVAPTFHTLFSSMNGRYTVACDCFSVFAVFFMTFTVWRCMQVYCRMSQTEFVFFLMVTLGQQVFGKKTTKVKCPSPIILEMNPT